MISDGILSEPRSIEIVPVPSRISFKARLAKQNYAHCETGRDNPYEPHSARTAN